MAPHYLDSRPRLKTYLDSGLQRLPVDWSLYLPNRSKENYCLFCDEFHDSNEVMVVTPDLLRKNGQMTNSFSCDECFHFIKVKEAEIFSNEGRVKQSVYNSKEVEDRIRIFIESYRFKDDVNCYIKHWHDTEMNVPVKPSQCYFCNEFTQEAEYRYIDVPVDNQEYITGGDVRCCDDCWLLIRDGLPENSLSILRRNHKIYDSHCDCGRTYVVTERELADRHAEGALDHHICPSCTALQLQTDAFILDMLMSTETLIVDSLETPSPRYKAWQLYRFIEIDCGFCHTTSVTIDLTLKASVMRFRHMGQSKFLCEHCRQGSSDGPIVTIPYSANNRQFYWHLYALGPNIYRKVIRGASGHMYQDYQLTGWLFDIVVTHADDFFPNPPKNIVM